MRNEKFGKCVAMLAIVAMMSSGCSSMSKTESGAAVGAVGGAAAGAIIGHATGNTTRGAIIGAVVGGAAGAYIGHKMDERAKELEKIPGATVERVGEGITVTFASGLLYDYDSDRVRSDAAANLRTLAQSLDKYPDTDLLIAGHTDADGSDAYNQELSERRAAAAASYLASQGVSRTRIRTSGLGESEPVVVNDTEANKQKNRRVEIAIYANEKARASFRQQYGPGRI